MCKLAATVDSKLMAANGIGSVPELGAVGLRLLGTDADESRRQGDRKQVGCGCAMSE